MTRLPAEVAAIERERDRWKATAEALAETVSDAGMLFVLLAVSGIGGFITSLRGKPVPATIGWALVAIIAVGGFVLTLNIRLRKGVSK